MMICVLAFGPFAWLFVVGLAVMMADDPMTPNPVMQIAAVCVMIGYGLALLVTFWGAYCMANLMNYRLSFASALLGSMLCIPFAWNAIGLLLQPEIREAFRSLDRLERDRRTGKKKPSTGEIIKFQA